MYLCVLRCVTLAMEQEDVAQLPEIHRKVYHLNELFSVRYGFVFENA